MKAGFDFSHNQDATSRLRNQTGTYYYSSVENFASDALAFSAFGLNGQLNPMDQHNCDQTGKAWRDSSACLHGLGYLPCYSYYSQTMGPTDWWLSTNDWAGYVTAQWQPANATVLTTCHALGTGTASAAHLCAQQSRPALTQNLPSLGNQWGPRAGFAWGIRREPLARDSPRLRHVLQRKREFRGGNRAHADRLTQGRSQFLHAPNRQSQCRRRAAVSLCAGGRAGKCRQAGSRRIRARPSAMAKYTRPKPPSKRRFPGASMSKPARLQASAAGFPSPSMPTSTLP